MWSTGRFYAWTASAMVAMCLGGGALARGDGRGGEALEPPLELVVEMGGKETLVELDKVCRVEVDGKQIAFTLRAKPTRHFACGGVEFQYPREYGFEADLSSAEFAQWTLSGNDMLIMLQRYRGEFDVDHLRQLLADSLVERYQQEHVKSSESKLVLGGREMVGKRLEVKLAGSLLRQEIYGFVGGAKVTYLLVLQDSPGEQSESAEYARAVPLLRETFKFPLTK